MDQAIWEVLLVKDAVTASITPKCMFRQLTDSIECHGTWQFVLTSGTQNDQT
jgi:hypothetical protein